MPCNALPLGVLLGVLPADWVYGLLSCGSPALLGYGFLPEAICSINDHKGGSQQGCHGKGDMQVTDPNVTVMSREVKWLCEPPPPLRSLVSGQ